MDIMISIRVGDMGVTDTGRIVWENDGSDKALVTSTSNPANVTSIANEVRKQASQLARKLIRQYLNERK